MGEPAAEMDDSVVISTFFELLFNPTQQDGRGLGNRALAKAPIRFRDLADIEAVKNPDGSTTILVKEKGTGEKVGEIHVKPGPEGRSVTVTGRDKDGTELTYETGLTENPDGSVKIHVESNTVGDDHYSGEMTIKNDPNGLPSSAEVHVTKNGETNTVTVGVKPDGTITPAPDAPTPVPTKPDTAPPPEPDDGGIGRGGRGDGGGDDGGGIIDDRPIGGDGQPIIDRTA